MAFVPQHTGKDSKTGEPFTYGGYEVTLTECALDGNVYANLEQHALTPAHKAAKQTSA